MVKKGDQVIVAGESNEVFIVIGVEKDAVILHTGWKEPINKCTIIPEKYHGEIYSTIHSYIDTEIMLNIINGEENEKRIRKETSGEVP